MSVSEHSVVHSGARLGRGVSVGPFTIVHDGVEIEDGSRIGSHCVLGHPTPDGEQAPLRVGPRAVIRSHSVLYAGSSFGSRLETGHGVVVREGVVAGQNLRLGTLCDLQGDSRIGDFVRLHSNVFAGKHTVLGDFVWAFPHAVFTNDPHPPSEVQQGAIIEDFAVIAARVVVLPGVRVGEGAVVGAGSVVTRDVNPGDLAVGTPAKRVQAASEVRLRDRPDLPAYPWRSHFARGFPEAIVQRWRDEEGLPVSHANT